MNGLKKIIEQTAGNRTAFLLSFLPAALLNDVPYLNLYLGRFMKIFLVWGAFLLVYQVLSRPGFRRSLFSPSMLLLFAFLAVNVVTVFLHREYPLRESLPRISYMLLYFGVLYGQERFSDAAGRQKTWYRLSVLLVVIIAVFSLIGFASFLWSIQFAFRRGEQTIWFGMKDYRLWGLFNANVGGMFCVIAIGAALYLLSRKPRRAGRVALAASIVFQWLTLILTQSRGALGALVVMCALIAFGMCYNRGVRARGGRRAAVLRSFAPGVASAVAVALALILAGPLVRQGLSYVPWVVSSERALALQEAELSGLHLAVGDDELWNEDELLKRPKLERIEKLTGAEVTSGRKLLWSSGIEEWKREPVFGLSYEGMVDKVSERVGTSMAGNIRAGGLHNIYVTVLVVTGVVGAVVFLAFLLLQAGTALHSLQRTWRGGMLLQWDLLISVSLAFGILVAEVVEARTLYGLNFVAVVTWYLLGYSGREMDLIKKSEIRSNDEYGLR
ncbi:MAG: O-antigen ligase family protein [Ndongobacter sp.]|nr:O-antigen ligase family protein [Ndongobacter sp.]